MNFYLMRAKVSQEAMNALVERPEDRLISMTKVLQGVGGRLHYYFFCFGKYDIVLIYELPDNLSAAALSMVLTSSGSVTEVDTTPLLTMQEAIESMQQAGAAMGVYRPPGRTPADATKAPKPKRKNA